MLAFDRDNQESFRLNSNLFPIFPFRCGFSTNHDFARTSASNVIYVALNDKALGVHKVFSKTNHNVVQPPQDGSSSSSSPNVAWEAFYPKGSINPSGGIPGGFGFYLSGPSDFARALEEGAEDVVMSYSMMLPEEWEWVKGGKLPGVFGGIGENAYGCTGGRKENRCSCFDIRLMWRSNSVGELYVYAPLTDNNKSKLLAVPPRSTENADYGFSVGRNAFTFPVGRWTAVALRVKTSSEEAGEIQLWIDGKSVISVSGLTIPGKVKGMHFQTFFGGHSPEWASPKDQRAWFSDISGAVIG